MSRKEKRNQEIMQAAYRLFVEKGFDAVTMADIADEAGIGVATVFRYFPKKNKLIIAVIVQILKERVPSFEAIRTSEGTCYDKIDRLLTHYIDVSDSHELNDMKLLEAFEAYAAYAQEPLEDIEEYHKAYRAITNVIGQIIDENRHDGSIRPELANRDVLDAISNMMGVFTRKLSFFETVQIGRTDILPIEQAVIVKNIFMDYLLPSKKAANDGSPLR